MTIPPEAGVAALLAQALLMVLPYALGRRRSRSVATPVPESPEQVRTRLDAERARISSEVKAYLDGGQGRTVIDAMIQHRMRSMLTAVMLSCAGIRMPDQQLSQLRDEVIQHVRDALHP